MAGLSRAENRAGYPRIDAFLTLCSIEPMRKVYSAANLQEAYLLLHRLQHAGIPARVLNEHAQGGLGELPFTHVYPEVWVTHDADVERARAVVTEHERAGHAAASSRPCRFCREQNPGSFESCWRCGAPLDP